MKLIDKVNDLVRRAQELEELAAAHPTSLERGQPRPAKLTTGRELDVLMHRVDLCAHNVRKHISAIRRREAAVAKTSPLVGDVLAAVRRAVLRDASTAHLALISVHLDVVAPPGHPQRAEAVALLESAWARPRLTVVPAPAD